MALRLLSNDFDEGGTLPLEQAFNGFGHNGGNVSPELHWEGAPEGTKSFVLSLYDPDAPTGSGFWHWVVVDIPANATDVAKGAGSDTATLPSPARQTLNDLSQNNYAGGAPPPGPAHRYVFTLHALSVDKLPVPNNATGALVGLMAGFHELERATLTVTFGV